MSSTLFMLAQAAGQQPSGIMGLLGSPLTMMIVVFGVFWLLVLRPQRKEHEERQTYLAALKKGDEVVTNGGVLGKVVAVDDKVVTLEIARNTKMRVLRAQISGSQAKVLSDASEAEASKKKDDEDASEEESEDKASTSGSSKKKRVTKGKGAKSETEEEAAEW